MANYQRFQTLSAAAQNRFDPDSPVWVSRYRLSRDLESGKRLLQVRMVNMSDKRISRVYLRVKCSDAEGRRLAVLEMLPLPSLLALPGRAFGDDKILEITPERTAFVEAYAQRVLFTDGTSWNETSTNAYGAFAAPVPVKAGDEHYQLLKDRAQAGGVQNRYYFKAQKDIWTCTCGQPNGSGALRCAHCGADRLWLEQNMDPEAAPAPPEPVSVPVPPPAPEPAPVVVPVLPMMQPAQPAPRMELTPQLPARRPAYEPDPEEGEKQRHPGRTVAIVLGILAFLAIGVWCAMEYLQPYLRYREAEKAQSAGDYDRAAAIFEEIGDYRDSPERVNQNKLQKIRDIMSGGDYQQAMALLEEVRDLPEYDAYMADCIYSLGVLAFNAGDVDSAWGYVQQLEEAYPDYVHLPELRQYCYYSFGNRTATQAAEMADPLDRIAAYERAIEEFTQTGGYADSAERITECRYRIGIERMNLDDLTGAIEIFDQLGDYKSSVQYRSDCMYRYAKQHMENTDDTSMDYLEELSESGYEGAQELLDRYTGEAFEFHITLGPTDNTATVAEVTDLNNIYIHYTVESKDEEGPVLVLARYTLPDGRQGRGLLNSDRTAAGAKAWSAMFPVDCAVSGTVTLEFFDSERGEQAPISTVSFSYVYQPPAPEPEETDNPDKPEG